MSNVQRIENMKQIVHSIEPSFNELAKIHNAVNYKREASFALQALDDNSYLAGIALGDPDSLKRAVINIAAIGLSLNPIQKLAYLVPRDKRVHLDISYRGFIQLAADIGAIKWAIAEIVREKDQFTYQGIGKEPSHVFNPFSDRGEILGAYCLAKTHDGEFIVTHMSLEEIYSIRDRSPSWRAYSKDKSKLTPWITDESEMIKKTVIRRAWKSWPMTDTRDKERFEKAIDVSNEVDPIDFGPEAAKDVRHQENVLDQIRSSLKELNRTEEKFVEHLVRVNRRDIKKLEDLTEIEASQALTLLASLIETKKSKELKSENAG